MNSAQPKWVNDPWTGEALPKVCVAIATRGRPDLLAKIVSRLERQTLPPAAILISCTGDSDVSGLQPDARRVILKGRAGLPAQRNLALDHIPPDADIVAFFDDDFVPDDGWLEAAAAVFTHDPTVACVTGDVVADGINGPGIPLDQAQGLIDAHRDVAGDWHIDGFSPYGCNMAFRRSAIRSLRFDERLVLYGWQEDRDFGATVAKHGGRLVKIGAAFGVHLGAKAGRTSGRRLGYSQLINPLYLVRKGTMSPGNALTHIACNMLNNTLRSVAPEPYIDRRGRLKGNLLAFRDLALGRAAPERAEQI
jgi:GT2 family glycosyltransferase